MKTRNFSVSLLIFSFGMLTISVLCSEISYSVNVQNVVNNISENFISYELNAIDITELSRSAQILKNLSQLSPCYIKLDSRGEFTRNELNSGINKMLIGDMMKVLE